MNTSLLKKNEFVTFISEKTAEYFELTIPSGKSLKPPVEDG